MTQEFTDNIQDNPSNDSTLQLPDNPFKPENIPYDGSKVISSHQPNNFTELAINSNTEKEEPEEKTEIQEASKEENNYTKEEFEKLATQNKELQEKMKSYNRMVEHFLEAKTKQKAEEPKQPKTELDQKLEQMYSQTKQEVVKEVFEEIQRQNETSKAISNFRSQNPDIANDPQKEYLIGLMAGQYCEKGLNVNEAIVKAINDFRNITGLSNNNTRPEQNNGKTSKHNIPHTRPQNTPSNTYIEGSSPSLPEKQFKASELINMQINKPGEYLRLQPQIMEAYRNGRVLFD